MAYIYDMAATWAAAGTTFTAIKMNVTDTASAAGSLLMDLQVGGVSRFSVDKNGAIAIAYNAAAGRAISYASGTNGFRLNGAGITGMNIERGDAARVASFVGTDSVLCGIVHIGATTGGANGNVNLNRDADDTLAQRRGVNAQAFRVYNTFTDASNYERARVEWASNVLTVGTQGAGTGAQRIMNIDAAQIGLLTGGAGRWSITGSGHFTAQVDNTYDIGASGATRPRFLYLGGGSLTGSQTDSSVTISPTWNTTGAPSAIKLNVTDTASAAGSLLMDLQVGGVSRARVRKDGRFIGTDFELATGQAVTNSGGIMWLYGPGVIASGGVRFAAVNGNETDTVLARDAANTLAQRNGVNAQAFRVYNTFTDASNYERAKVEWASNVLRIGTEKAGTGTARALEFQTDGVTRLTIAASSGSAGASFAVGIQTSDRLTIGQSGSGNAVQFLSDTGILRLLNGSGGGAAIRLIEQTAPAAPATNGVHIYAEDNGSGKTRLMALFATGAAQQIAIEP